MRTSNIAVLAAIIAGLVWMASGALSWGEVGLTDPSTLLWWAGVGLFALASALTGYAAVTQSPMWLRAVVFFGAAALGGSVVSSLDTDLEQAYLLVSCAGTVLLLLGVVGLLVGRVRNAPVEPTPQPPRGGRRAAR